MTWRIYSSMLSHEDNRFQDFMLENTPCLISGIITSNWPLFHHLFSTSDGSIENSNFNTEQGHTIITIHDTTRNTTCPMSISKFINALNNRESLYAKDWHMFQLCPSASYSTPVEFCDDWLNWYWKRCRDDKDDYRFIYIGGHQTQTLLHHDVICSYSWSINLHGRKRWYMWKPSDLPLLYDQHGEIVSDARDGMYDTVRFPRIRETTPVILLQEVNTAVFVPSGWYHQVENLGSQSERGMCLDDVTVSLNHNWINGYNVYESWRFLLRELNSVRREIWEFVPKDFEYDDLPTTTDIVADKEVSPNTKSLGFGLGGMSEAMRMEEGDWFRQCELLLTANAAMGVKHFLHMTCARIYLLVSIHMRKCEGFFAHQPYPVLLRLLGVDPTFFQESSSTIDPCSATVDTGGKLSTSLEEDTTRDEIAYEYLISHSVQSPRRSESHFLSAVLEDEEEDDEDSTNVTGDARKGPRCCERTPWRISVPLRNDRNGTDFLAGDDENDDEESGVLVEYPMSGMKFVTAEVMCVLQEMHHSKVMQSHLSHVLESGVEAIDLALLEFREYLQSAKSLM